MSNSLTLIAKLQVLSESKRKSSDDYEIQDNEEAINNNSQLVPLWHGNFSEVKFQLTAARLVGLGTGLVLYVLHAPQVDRISVIFKFVLVSVVVLVLTDTQELGDWTQYNLQYKAHRV